jgi:hypothetical protein
MMDVTAVIYCVLQRVWPTLGVGALAWPFFAWYLSQIACS